ncbi:hypothetical protein DPEC_G00176140 [Dallia pectoralis]|uniref:Uncharacterized protein n=1 Tax=Dallia pectoralis TaxID=75939 RepID=A0ACC2GEX8_DALPE|nr:hypothetical protein DPEC_G00176140 [Dallia pectoralis]
MPLWPERHLLFLLMSSGDNNQAQHDTRPQPALPPLRLVWAQREQIWQLVALRGWWWWGCTPCTQTHIAAGSTDQCRGTSVLGFNNLRMLTFKDLATQGV